jgi:hypothetical protein
VIFSKNFRIAYVVVNSKWNENKHFVARINAIQNTWATRIREIDTIFYPMERNKIDQIGKQENIIELPLDMVNYKILYMLGKLITETHSFDWVYIAADSSYVIPSNVEAFIAQLPNNNIMVNSDNKNNTNFGFSSSFINSLNRSECYYLGFPLEIPVKGYPSFFVKIIN